MKTILFLIFLTFHGIAFSQYEFISFAHGFFGERSPSVVLMDSLMKDFKYDEIRKMIFGADDHLKCLSIVACEVLEKEGIIKLTTLEKKEIAKAYHSGETIILVFGCTEIDKTNMRSSLNVFYSKEYDRIYKDYATRWYTWIAHGGLKHFAVTNPTDIFHL